MQPSSLVVLAVFPRLLKSFFYFFFYSLRYSHGPDYHITLSDYHVPSDHPCCLPCSTSSCRTDMVSVLEFFFSLSPPTSARRSCERNVRRRRACLLPSDVQVKLCAHREVFYRQNLITRSDEATVLVFPVDIYFQGFCIDLPLVAHQVGPLLPRPKLQLYHQTLPHVVMLLSFYSLQNFSYRLRSGPICSFPKLLFRDLKIPVAQRPRLV